MPALALDISSSELLDVEGHDAKYVLPTELDFLPDNEAFAPESEEMNIKISVFTKSTLPLNDEIHQILTLFPD